MKISITRLRQLVREAIREAKLTESAELVWIAYPVNGSPKEFKSEEEANAHIEKMGGGFVENEPSGASEITPREAPSGKSNVNLHDLAYPKTKMHEPRPWRPRMTADTIRDKKPLGWK